MIENATELFASIHQLSRMADMVEALRRDAEQRKDYRQFAHLSESYLHRIHELNSQIKEYLTQQPDSVTLATTH